MTDNLVERLREKAFRTETYELLEDAADHIEKLEAALLELSEDWGCCGITSAMRTIARKALEGKDE